MAKKTQTKIWLASFYGNVNLDFYPCGMTFGEKWNFPEYAKYDMFFGNQKTKNEEEKSLHMQQIKTGAEISCIARNFQKMDKAILPQRLYGHGPLGDKVTSIFAILNDFLILTEPAAELLMKFRLGETQLSKMSFYDYRTEELINDQTYYFFNLCEQRRFMLREYYNSPMEIDNKDENGVPQYYFMQFGGGKKGDYVLADEAVDCDVDIWHDPLLAYSIFMTDTLHDAIVEAGWAKTWKFVPCCLKSEVQGKGES